MTIVSAQTATSPSSIVDGDVATPPSSSSSSFAVLVSLSDSIGVSEDILLVFFCEMASLVFGLFFRFVLHPLRVGPRFRHWIEFLVGFALCVVCYGVATLHMAALATTTFITLSIVDRKWSHVAVASEVFVYLSALHLERMVDDYGGWTLTVATSVMLAVQKTTSLAFALYDNRPPEDEAATAATNAADQDPVSPETASSTPYVPAAPWNDACYRRLPTALEYFSYLFSFHGVLIGPIAFYHDYKRFVEGTNYVDTRTGTHPSEPTPLSQSPSPLSAIFRKLLQALLCCVVGFGVSPLFPVRRFVEEGFVGEKGILAAAAYLFVATSLSRFRYYFGWIIGDIVNLGAGFGYEGFDSRTQTHQWTLCENVNVWDIEGATSLKMLVDKWNKLTSRWLRHLVYVRLSAPANLLLTYFVSSVWHGFYPGYYFFFSSISLMTLAARRWRRSVRPLVLGDAASDAASIRRRLYDVATWLATQLAIAYSGAPFLLLSYEASRDCYSALWWSGHVGALLVVVVATIVGAWREGGEKKGKTE